MKARVGALVAAALLVGVFFTAPVVSYSKSFALPSAWDPKAFRPCSEDAYGTPTPPTSINVGNSTLMAEVQMYQNCLDQHQYPPYNLTGRASLSYSLFGVGLAPFPPQYYFSQGNYSGLVYFDGVRVTAAYTFRQPMIIDPRGVFELLNATIRINGFGRLEFAASIKNIGSAPISIGVGTSNVPGQPAPFNFSRGGVGWSVFPGDFASCSSYLSPGETCSANERLNPLNGTRVHYFVYVEGRVNGESFFYREEVEQTVPVLGLNQGWMSLFVGQINSQRAGPPLTENSTIDRFAKQRFATASSNPQISDYGYSADLTSFFGGSASTSRYVELLLFPGSSAPYSYLSDLQGSAPKHFSALMSSNFTQFGYYIGQAPYYLINSGCPVKEIPSAGINITQYFQGYGCTVTSVPDQNWLVIILGN